MDYFDDEDLTDDNAEPQVDISAIAAAAFDGDPDALALLDEMADNGDLDAMEYVELAEENFIGDL